MNQRIGYLFWILLLAIGLMILVVAAQVLTGNNINRLKQGNRNATAAFTMNNQLQELVNLSFELDAKLSSPAARIKNAGSVRDSLAVLEYDASLLSYQFSGKDAGKTLNDLKSFTNQQVKLGNRIIDLLLAGPAGNASLLADSFRRLHLSDSIYSKAWSVKIELEEDLQETLNRNTSASVKLSDYNKVLAIIAIAAVLILGTIIIHHHLKQVKLIVQLEKATATAEKSAAVKDQFLANMSHEIRTPLNAIRGFSRLLKQTSLLPDQQQYAKIIEEASGNLLYIVNDILDISKIEAGKFRIENKHFNLRSVLQTIEHIFSKSAAEKQLEYKQQIYGSVPVHLIGDPERLSQILLNLVSNAIKFTKEGFVKTIVSAAKNTEDKIWIRFSVEDSGIGIEPGKQALIFQRFEQLETGKENVTKGTGLGLSIVKSLATLMGGTISVSSQHGKGSVFTAELPFSPAGRAAETKEIKARPSDVSVSDYSGTSVLVVDDNKVNQLLIMQTLKILGIIPVTASNGEEALKAIETAKFSLVLMDIQMPVMDGYTAVKKLRKGGNKDLPVVAMTAYAMPGEKEKCIAAGMNDYMAKPVDFSELNSLLEKYCQPAEKSNILKDNSKTDGGDFLLQLAGGDKLLARLILDEIRNEIPGVISKLHEIKNNGDKESLGKLCHHLISTFAPLGSDTKIMKMIKTINSHYTKNEVSNPADFAIGLIDEITKFEIRIGQILLQF